MAPNLRHQHVADGEMRHNASELVKRVTHASNVRKARDGGKHMTARKRAEREDGRNRERTKEMLVTSEHGANKSD